MPTEKEFLSILEKDYTTYEKTIKSFLKSYSRIQEFLSAVFQILPSEIFVVLGFSICILFLLNSVSKKIREYHLLISVIITVFSCIVTSRYILHKHRDMGFLSSGMIILLPTYLYSFFVYIITYARKQYLKNKIASPIQIENSVHQLHISYNHSMQYLHKYLANNEINVSKVIENLEVLKLSTDALIKSLQFPVSNKSKDDEKPIIESSETNSPDEK